MPFWLVFKGHTDIGQASSLTGQVFDGASRGESSIKLKPSGLADNVEMSAELGTKAAYQLLSREGYIVNSVLIYHQIHNAPDNIQGESGGLAFALSTANLLLPPEHQFNNLAIVATGVIDNHGKITPIEGVQAKLRAALNTLVDGGYFISTEENIQQLTSEIKQQAKQQHIQFIAANHLADALVALGVPLRKAYLESPFVGLSSYSYQHRGVFFGRDREISEVVKLLNDQKSTTVPRLLVIGASGTGKSSLIQAGVLPTISQKVQTSVELPSHYIVYKPREAKRTNGDLGNPFISSLKIAMNATAPAVDLTHESNPSIETPAKFIFIDQLEECFTLKFRGRWNDTNSVLTQFFEYLQLLNSQGHWIVATLRSDFYSHYQKYEVLINFFGSNHLYDLLPPTEEAIEKIIESPAEVADFSYEVDKYQNSLSTLIRQDVGSEPGLLPLLSFVLTELYRNRDTRNRQLTFSSYIKLGGLKGGIGQRAEKLYQQQSIKVKNSLLTLIQHLTIIEDSEEGERVTARTLPYSQFRPHTPIKILVDSLLHEDYRLLVREGDLQKAYIRVAHEALLTHWERAKNIIIEYRDKLLQLSQLENQSKRYFLSNQKDKETLLIINKSSLNKALNLKELLDFDFSKEVQEYIDLSKKHRIKKIKRSFFFIGIIIFISSSFNYYNNYKKDEEEKIINEIAYAEELIIKGNASYNKENDKVDYSYARSLFYKALLIYEKYGINNIAANINYTKSINKSASEVQSYLYYDEDTMESSDQDTIIGIEILKDKNIFISVDVVGKVVSWDLKSGILLGSSNFQHVDYEERVLERKSIKYFHYDEESEKLIVMTDAMEIGIWSVKDGVFSNFKKYSVIDYFIKTQEWSPVSIVDGIPLDRQKHYFDKKYKVISSAYSSTKEEYFFVITEKNEKGEIDYSLVKSRVVKNKIDNTIYPIKHKVNDLAIIDDKLVMAVAGGVYKIDTNKLKDNNGTYIKNNSGAITRKIKVTSDGNYILSLDSNYEFSLWDLDKNIQKTIVSSMDATRNISAIDFNGDYYNYNIIVGQRNGIVKVQSSHSNDLSKYHLDDKSKVSVVKRVDDKYILLQGDAGFITLVNTKPVENLFLNINNQGNNIDNGVYLSSKELVYHNKNIDDKKSTLSIYSIQRGDKIIDFNINVKNIINVYMSNFKKSIYITYFDEDSKYVIGLYSFETGEVEDVIFTSEKKINNLTISKDKNSFSIETMDGTLSIVNVITKQVFEIKKFTSDTRSYSMSDDASILSISSSKGTYLLERGKSFYKKLKYIEHKSEIKIKEELTSGAVWSSFDILIDPTSFYLSGTGNFMALGDGSGDFSILDLEKNEIISNFYISELNSSGVLFSKDDSLLIAGSNNGEMKIWSTKTGQELFSYSVDNTDPSYGYTTILSTDGKIVYSKLVNEHQGTGPYTESYIFTGRFSSIARKLTNFITFDDNYKKEPENKKSNLNYYYLYKLHGSCDFSMYFSKKGKLGKELSDCTDSLYSNF